MSAELAIREPEPSALPAWMDMPEEQKALLKQACASANLNDPQFSLLVEVARRAGLDPFRRHIYGLFFDGKFTLVTGIDGFRAVARRNGLAGMDDVVYTYDEADEKQLFPKSATITIYRRGPNGERDPYTATARWREYARYFNDKQKGRTLQSNWQTKGHIMLGKCAEALALRKAFTESLGGIYERAEFGEADGDAYRRAKQEPLTLAEIVAAEGRAIDTTATERVTTDAEWTTTDDIPPPEEMT